MAKPRLKRIQLENIWPCREIRVTSAGADVSFHGNKGCRIVPGILYCPANKVLGVFGDPGVIRRNMIWHEIQKEHHASLCQFLTCNGETRWTPEVSVDYIASHAVGRS